MSGKATDFAETEKNTYDVIALKIEYHYDFYMQMLLKS